MKNWQQGSCVQEPLSAALRLLIASAQAWCLLLATYANVSCKNVIIGFFYTPLLLMGPINSMRASLWWSISKVLRAICALMLTKLIQNHI